MAVPPKGTWCPAVTFYHTKEDELDLEAQKKYYAYLSKTGLAGLVIMGTNGETMLLTREERAALLKTARSAVGPDFPIMAGVSGFSNKQVMEYIHDAHAAGANYALLLPAAYFGKATTQKVIEGFYDDIASRSPLPIVIYNFPVVCNGVDIDSETITALAQRHPGKITGVKLTCASVGKIVRLGAELPPDQFSTYGGQSDFLIGGLTSGSAGCIAAFANVFPKTVSKIYELQVQGKTEEALKLHQKAAIAESPCKAGIASTKYAAAVYTAAAAGIDDAEVKLRPRAPYLPPSKEVQQNIRRLMDELAEYERSL
jgi:4-hydroxy-2-oxoglutarate aldolase